MFQFLKRLLVEVGKNNVNQAHFTSLYLSVSVSDAVDGNVSCTACCCVVLYERTQYLFRKWKLNITIMSSRKACYTWKNYYYYVFIKNNAHKHVAINILHYYILGIINIRRITFYIVDNRRCLNYW